MPSDTISALIPHYGFSPTSNRWLSQCIRSLLEQTTPLDRVIVVDDVSPCPPEDTVRAFPEVSLYRNSHNTGPFTMIDRVFADIDSDYILLQDSDDWSSPDRLELLLSGMRNWQTDVIGCQVSAVSAVGDPLESAPDQLPSDPPRRSGRESFSASGPFCRRRWSRVSSLAGSVDSLQVSDSAQIQSSLAVRVSVARFVISRRLLTFAGCILARSLNRPQPASGRPHDWRFRRWFKITPGVWWRRSARMVLSISAHNGGQRQRTSSMCLVLQCQGFRNPEPSVPSWWGRRVGASKWFWPVVWPQGQLRTKPIQPGI